MELMTIDYLYIGASLFGIIVFIYTSLKILDIMKLLPPGSKTRKSWTYAFVLILLFALGYIFSIIAIFVDKTFLDQITPVIYVFGAVFVYIMVTVSLRTYKAILESAE